MVGEGLDGFSAKLTSKLKAYINSNKNKATECLRRKGTICSKVQSQEGAEGSSVCLGGEEHGIALEKGRSRIVI